MKNQKNKGKTGSRVLRRSLGIGMACILAVSGLTGCSALEDFLAEDSEVTGGDTVMADTAGTDVQNLALTSDGEHLAFTQEMRDGATVLVDENGHETLYYEAPDNYTELVGQIIGDNWQDNYISQLRFIIGVDGCEVNYKRVRGAAVTKTNKGQFMIPMDAFLQAVGATYDELTDKVVMHEDGVMSKKGVRKADSDGNFYLSEDVIVNDLGFEILYENDETISFTKAYQTRRILVTDCDINLGEQNFGADVVITDGDGFFVLQYDTVEDTKEAFAELEALLGEDHVEEDYVVQACAPAGYEGSAFTLAEVGDHLVENGETSVRSNRALDARAMHHRVNSSSYLSWGAGRIGADDFVNSMTSSQKNTRVVVAVIDTGADADHSFLSGKLTSGTSIIGSSYDDQNGHGTHVSGTIVDVTRDCNVMIMPVQVLDSSGSGTNLSIATGVNYAVNNGANIINLSLGGYDYSSNHTTDSNILSAISKGVTVCAAAGNDGASMASFCPAHISGVFCVGAVDSSDTIAYFSNYGSNVGISAPGVDVYSAYMGGGYSTLSGTSMATPHVAAACALVYASGIATSPSGIMSAIENAADDRGSSGKDNYYGYGIVNLTNLSAGTPSETQAPTNAPTQAPTTAPTQGPTQAPIIEDPIELPTQGPTNAPTSAPTQSPNIPDSLDDIDWEGWEWLWTDEPYTNPTTAPTVAPTTDPYNWDWDDGGWDWDDDDWDWNWDENPTTAPTVAPTNAPTEAPTLAPTTAPTAEPTAAPTVAPTVAPTQAPTPEPTVAPTQDPWNWTYPSDPFYSSSGISVSVSSSNGNTTISLTTSDDLSCYSILVDGADFSGNVVSCGNGSYYIDLSSVGSGYHTYSISNGCSSCSGSFTK